jgi:hypothetical protein
LGFHLLRNPTRSEWFFGRHAPEHPLRHALIAGAFVLVTLGVYFGVNYAKFRSFNAVPLQYYYYYKLMPARMQITGGRQIHVENIPTAVANYFGVRGFEIGGHFPWLDRTRHPVFVGTPAIDMVDGFSSIPVSMPALTALAIIGAWAILRGRSETTRRLRLPAAALLIGGSIVLATVALCERYLHDFYPVLIVLAAAGLCRVTLTRGATWKILIVAILTIFSVGLNCAFAINHQRLTAGASPAKVAEFQGWQQRVDRLLHTTEPR